jgi:hypothetical protein
MTAEAQAKLLEAFEARQRGEWDKALDLLRRWRAHIDPSLVSYLRGSIWLEAGDPETAALFYAHAHKLEPTNGNYQAMTLYSLNIADSAAALKEATKILRNHEHSSPAGVARAADIVFMSARLKSEIEANHLFEQIEPILKATLARMRQGDLAQIDRSSYVTLLSLLGFGYEFFGKSQAALEIYSEALQIEPDNDAIHVARGMLLYGTSARAIADFETAIQNGTPLVWPYVSGTCPLYNGEFLAPVRRCGVVEPEVASKLERCATRPCYGRQFLRQILRGGDGRYAPHSASVEHHAAPFFRRFRATPRQTEPGHRPRAHPDRPWRR